ncbi:MAG TPA: peptidylprolyl isomerase [Chloroflexia bacterium]
MGQSGSGGSGGTGGSGGRSERSRPPGGGNRPAGSSGTKGTGGQARRPASQSQGRAAGNRPSGGGASRPAVKREAATAAPATGFRATVDRTLPQFSIQRYVVIWALMMVPLGLVLFLLLRPGGNTCQAPNAAGKYFVIDTAKGCIVTRLYTEASANVANTIANFEQKASSGFFNGLIFHRVEDWVIQGGDPTGTGSGGNRMPSEYNEIPFKAGSLGIARGQDPAQNNDSQFFIIKSFPEELNGQISNVRLSAESLTGQYTNWGEVVQGMEVVDRMAVGDKINSATVVERK